MNGDELFEHYKDPANRAPDMPADFDVAWVINHYLPGLAALLDERCRQVVEEGHSFEHDDEHDNGELVLAALWYLSEYPTSPPIDIADVASWPWEADAWKPSDNPFRNLVKAGALIVAELDRLIRKENS